MLKGFKEFLLRGNVIDLAVAVVIGAAFTAIVNSVVSNIFNPLIGALFNANSLDNALDVALPLSIVGEEGEPQAAVIKFGAVIGAAITFTITAAVVYFAFVMPINFLRKRAEERKKAGVEEPAEAAAPTEAELLAEIRDLLKGRQEQ